MISDTIVLEYSKHLISNDTQYEKDKIHLFDTCFYMKLIQSQSQQQQRQHNNTRQSSSSKNIYSDWDKHIDIFTEDFLIIPICLDHHWLLGIVNFIGKFPPPPQSSSSSSPINITTTTDNHEIKNNYRYNDDNDKNHNDNDDNNDNHENINNNTNTKDKTACIFIFDSLKSYGDDSQDAGKLTWPIREFLNNRWQQQQQQYNNEQQSERNFSDKSLMPEYIAKVPLQKNSFDCGIHLLCTLEKFLK